MQAVLFSLLLGLLQFVSVTLSCLRRGTGGDPLTPQEAGEEGDCASAVSLLESGE